MLVVFQSEKKQKQTKHVEKFSIQIKVKCHFKDTRVVLIEEGIKFDDLQKRVQEKFETSKLKVTPI